MVGDFTRKQEKIYKMDTVKIASISLSNYALNLGQVNDVLQIVVACLSIFLLIRKMRKKNEKTT